MGYSKNQVQTIPQLRVKVSPSGQEKYPLDITVFRDERKSYYNVYMLVECKQPNRKDGRKQLDIYLNLVPLVEKGDVLIAITGTVGAITLLPSIFYQGNISQNVVRIRILEEWLNKVLNINHQEINEDKVFSVNFTDLTDILTPKFYYPKYLNTFKALKKKFKTVKLGEIADIKRGDEVGSKNYRKYVDRKDSDVPFIRTSDLVNYEIDNYPDYYIDEGIYKELKQDLEEGDIIYTKDGKICLAAILTSEDKCILASGLVRIRVKKELNPYYVFLVLSTNIGYYQAMQRVVIVSTLQHLQLEQLEETEIPVIDEQIYNQISQLVAEAFKLKTEKKKLFREVLTKVEELLK